MHGGVDTTYRQDATVRDVFVYLVLLFSGFQLQPLRLVVIDPRVIHKRRVGSQQKADFGISNELA